MKDFRKKLDGTTMLLERIYSICNVLLETMQYKPTGTHKLEAMREDGVTSYNSIFKQF
jgi:hypothetical protein